MPELSKSAVGASEVSVATLEYLGCRFAVSLSVMGTASAVSFTYKEFANKTVNALFDLCMLGL